MSVAIARLGELRIDGFIEGTVNNWVIFSPLLNSKMHSSGVDGNVFLSATPSVEIVDADLDVPIPDGTLYSYSVGTDNRIKVAFDKKRFLDKASAIAALNCVSVTYQIGNLSANGNLFILIVRNSLGEEIHRTTPLPLQQIHTVMSTFDDTRATDYGGFLKFEIIKDYIVS